MYRFVAIDYSTPSFQWCLPIRPAFSQKIQPWIQLWIQPQLLQIQRLSRQILTLHRHQLRQLLLVETMSSVKKDCGSVSKANGRITAPIAQSKIRMRNSVVLFGLGLLMVRRH